MKKHILSALFIAALTTFARAEKVSATATAAVSAQSSVKLSGLHLCCKSCVTGVEKAVATVKGVTVECDKDAGTATLSAADKAVNQKAVDAIVAAGYFGKSGDSEISFKDTSGATEGKVSSLTVSGVHLCCGKCVTTVNKAIEKVKGVTGNTAEKNAKSFEVKGDFSPKELFGALQSAGLTGKAGK